jgi:hypothetical protein
MIDEHDAKENYCRRLGHKVPFVYCRQENMGLPCAKMADCWFELLPIENFIFENYSPEERSKILAPPKSKINSLLDIIDKIKKQHS